MLKGIDISHHQGNVDFNKALKDLDFIILKGTQGLTYLDPKFESYYNQINNSIPVGAYIYNKVKNVDEAKKEAQFFVDKMKGKNFSAGVWLDMEDSTMADFSKELKSEIIRAEASILRNAGYNVGIYCSYNWYKNKLNAEDLCRDFVFWIARYTSAQKDSPLKNQKNCFIWQNSSKGSIDGIAGNVDMNKADQNPVDVMNFAGGAVKKSNKTDIKYYPAYNGNLQNLDKILESIGVPSYYRGSLENRKKLVRAQGGDFKNYNGTYTQNLFIIQCAREGKLKVV